MGIRKKTSAAPPSISPSNGSPIVKSGKTGTGGITDATVRQLERVGSSESAKIARDYVT